MTNPTNTLQETLLVVHFMAPLNLTVMDMADWVSEFSSDFPELQQTPAAPRVDLVPSFAFQLELPRLILRSAQKQLSVQLQADRFGFGWIRTRGLGEPDNYPGYDTMKAMWLNIIKQFDTWVSRRFGGMPASRLVELSYHNALPLERHGKKRRLSEVFRFVTPGNRPVNGFTVNWSEFLAPAADAPRVLAQTGLGTDATGQPVFMFNYTGLGTVANVPLTNQFVEMLDRLHDRIVDMHKAAIILDELVESR